MIKLKAKWHFSIPQGLRISFSYLALRYAYPSFIVVANLVSIFS